MKTLVLANQKGGVGKSAVATLLAHYLAQHGQRVLAIDLDHQGNFNKPLRMSKRPAIAGVTADQLLTGGTSATFQQLFAKIPDQHFVIVPSGRALLGLERQPALHNTIARGFRLFLAAMDKRFDVCVVDTNPNPDIRLIAALASADFVLSPIQLNQEALDGVTSMLSHERVGVRKIKALLNPKLDLIGLLPTMVEPTPFQKANFVQVVQRYQALMIPIGPSPGEFAWLPRRSSIAEAQSAGEVLWEMKKTAARDTWKEIETSIATIAGRVTGGTVGTRPGAKMTHAAAAA